MKSPSLKPPASLARIIIVRLICYTSLMMGGVGLINYFNEQSRLDDRLRKNLETFTDRLSADLALSVWNADDRQIRNNIVSGLQDQAIQGIALQVQEKSYFVTRDAAWKAVFQEKQFPETGLIPKRVQVFFQGREVGRMTVYATPRFMREELRRMILGTGASIVLFELILVLTLYLLLWHTILRPIRRLEQYSLAVSSDNRVVPTEVVRFRGELGTLRKAMEHMVSQLDTRYAELQAFRDNLEITVAERTADFEKARLAAEDANRAKSAFLAAMSHEIRTPMNAVLNMVGTVLESPLDETQKEYLKVADTSARHLLSVINDILDFSKIESGKLEIENIPFSLHGLLESVANLFRTKVAETKVELVLDIEPGVADGVRGDPTRLRQILVNLTGNAFKFTPKGQIVLRAESRESGIRILVADSGIGIPAQSQAKLFQPFTQAESSTARRFGGTGLGLAISRRLAELMGGEITFSSVEGEGTVFTVDLPLAPEPAGNREELGLAGPLQGRAALLIEDNAPSREAVRRMLARHGLVCIPFPAVEPALEWLRSPEATDIAVALVDWQLAPGGLDGIAGVVELRRLRAGLPCFLISAFAGPEVQVAASAAGASAFIPKPVTWAATRSALHAVMAPAPASETQGAAPESKPFEGVRALLAEDNLQNQLVAKILLKKLGIELDVADNGRIALEKARDNPERYRLILMDMQMPELDGLEATRKIRELGAEIPALKNVPILAMTANAMKSDFDACIEAGMNGWVTKPIDKTALRSELERVLNPPAADS